MAVNLLAPEIRANPYPLYAELRRDHPVTMVDHTFKRTAWFVSRYDDVLMVLKDPRFSNEARKVSSSKGRFDKWYIPKIFNAFANSMLTVDDPQHRRLRDLVHKAFTPRIIERMAERIDTISNELLDRAVKKPQVDLVADFALPLPLTVISDMMGVPQKDRKHFHKWTAMFLDSLGGSRTEMLTQLPNAYRMLSFFKHLINLRRRDPQDDLITGLVQAEQDGDHLTEDEMVAMIFLLLLAGHETTVNLISNGTLALLQFPDQLEKLKQNPQLMDSAIEELLRFTNPVDQLAPRYALEDVPLYDQVIPKGSIVLAGLASANHDESVFPNADQLDITRSPNRHLAFGFGVHYCLGAPLARMEGKIAFQNLLGRHPNLQLAIAPEQIQWRSAINVRGVKALPVRLKG